MNIQWTPRWVAQAAALLMGGAWAISACADTPLSLTLSETLTYDSNIKKDNTNKYRDVVSATGVKVQFDKDYGRQNYSASILAVANRYKNSKDLDNDGYNVKLGFSTTLASDWLVSLTRSQTRQLQPFAEQVDDRTKEIIQNGTTSFYAIYGLSKKLAPSITISSTDVKYDVFNSQDKSTKYARLGLRYRPSDLLYFEGGFAKTDVEAPGYPIFKGYSNDPPFIFGDPVRRNDFDVSSQWVVTGFSRLDARLAWTDEKHANDEFRNYNGLTGHMAWSFSPAGKVSYTLSAERDTDNAGGSGTGNSVVQQNKVTTALAVGANWAATSKLSANADFSWQNYKEQRQQTGRSDVARNSRYLGLTLGGRYSPTRYASFDCSLTKYDRSAAVSSRAFSGDTVECSAALMIDP